MKKIIFFGDSLTAGYGLKSAEIESFPALIQQMINKNGQPYQVVNAGLSGDTSENGKQRLKAVIHQQIDVFVLALGANDLLRGISPEITYFNLKAILDQIIAEHPDVKLLLIGMDLPAWIPGQRVADFRNVFRRLANEYEIAFVPFLLAGVGGVKQLNLPDGVHPLAEGYQIIAKTIWNELKNLL